MNDLAEIIRQIQFMEGLPASMREAAADHLQGAIDALPASLRSQFPREPSPRPPQDRAVPPSQSQAPT